MAAKIAPILQTSVRISREPARVRRPPQQTDPDPTGRPTVANVLANIFGSSPVRPLEKHVDIAFRCTRELNPFFAAVVKEDWKRAGKVRDKIAKLEHEADDLKKKIRLHLPKSLFMPVPRQDLLELLLVQDKMANRTKDVSGLVLGRKMTIPSAIAEDFLEFVDRNVDAAKQARKSVRELDELFTTGFRGAEVALVEALIEELDRIETDTDDRQADLRLALFKIENEFPPIDVMFLYRVIELTGEIADMAERVGRRLELLFSH
jgi:predicted phosphate transport protein (TIGR00153 family)